MKEIQKIEMYQAVEMMSLLDKIKISKREMEEIIEAWKENGYIAHDVPWYITERFRDFRNKIQEDFYCLSREYINKVLLEILQKNIYFGDDYEEADK